MRPPRAATAKASNGCCWPWTTWKKTTQDPDAPGWHSAARHVSRQPLFRNALMRTLAMDPRQRDSIALTMRKAVTPWMRLALRGMNEPTFDESFLSDPDATLFILAPPEGSIAGAAVTLLEHLVRSWRGKTARKEMLHRLLMVIDEAANVAPMPALRRHVSEGRGLGVNLLFSVQASSQFDTVYGSSLRPRAARHLPGRADHVRGRGDGDAAARRTVVTRNHPPPRELRSGQRRQDACPPIWVPAWTTGGCSHKTSGRPGCCGAERRASPPSCRTGRTSWKIRPRGAKLLQADLPEREPATLWEWVLQRHRRAMQGDQVMIRRAVTRRAH